MNFDFRALRNVACALAITAACADAAAARADAFLTPAGWPPIVHAAALREQLGPGVSYARWQLVTSNGPLQISLATIDLRHPDVSLAVAVHHDAIVGLGERLSALADRLRAECAINADYFDINDTGTPTNVVVKSGAVLHQPNGRAVFVIGAGNRIAMGPLAWSGRLRFASGAETPIAAINDFAAATQISLVTGAAGTPEVFSGSEVVLTPGGPAGVYRVKTAVANATSIVPVEANDVGVVAHGAAAAQLLSTIAVGDQVTLAQDLSGAPFPVVDAVGGGPVLLRGGQSYADPDPPAPWEANERYPLTGAGVSGDGSTLWLVVVDGRAPASSMGITRPMLGALLASLGAADAMAFDSGGSSEMVVRHLGDGRATVANVPSDGGERPIADGLFVINSAPAGPPASLVVRASRPAVLVGSAVRMQTAAIDQNMQPVPVPGQITVEAVPAGAARVSGNLVRAVAAGTVIVTARAASVVGSTTVSVVPSVARLRISAPNRAIAPGASEGLGVEAQTAAGDAIAVDLGAVRWRAESGGRVDAAGRFTAGTRAARVPVSAIAGDASAQFFVLVGEHGVPLAMDPSKWRFTTLPAGLPGGVDDTPAPDGSAALRLAYDFSSVSGFRAAYAQTSLAIAGQPLAIELSVYGDGRGVWLRGAYRNADEVVDTVTLARRVDWTGWRRLRVPIKTTARWPIALTRLYAIETSASQRDQGSLWFKDLAVVYPGP